MFFGFISKDRPTLKTDPYTLVTREGFHAYVDLSNSRCRLLDRKVTTLLFWGRIYDRSDPITILEPLLENYERDRDAKRIFDYLEGDFSLVLFDHDRQKGYLGRDRFARGEIYWCTHMPFSFFTHPRLFFEATGCRAELNYRLLWDRFAIGAATPPETVYKHVFNNVTGEYIEADAAGEIRRVPYWSPMEFIRNNSTGRIHNAGRAIESIRDCFIKKVSLEISPYRKLGTGLSGGMDSAAVLGAARKSFDGDIIAVTVGPNGPSSPDLPHARESAGFNKADHLEYYPRAVDLEDFPGVMGGLAQPFRSASSFMNHQIAKRGFGEGGECGLWGYGADLIFGNAGYYRRFYNQEGGLLPPYIADPLIHSLQLMPQNRIIVGAINRLLWQRNPHEERLAERYFRVCKKPRYYQERRLFRNGFLTLGREAEILKRIEEMLNQENHSIVERLMEADYKIVHMYHQVSGTHQVCRADSLDSIITYYNKDYAEMNIRVSDDIRAMGHWNKYVLREAFRPLVTENVYRGTRGACIIPWDRIITGSFKDAVVRYLFSSTIIREIFKTRYLPHLEKMIKHPGLMYLNLLGLALWHDVQWNRISRDMPLSDILEYTWQEQDKQYPTG